MAAKKGVVIPIGASGEWDDSYYSSLSYLQPSIGVIYADGYVRAYYSAYDGSTYRVGVAVSRDGVNFTRKGVISVAGSSGQIDDAYILDQSIIYKDGYYWAYYSAFADTSNARISLAVSKDGINFVKKGVVLPLGSSGDLDDYKTYKPSAIYKDGYFRLYYAPAGTASAVDDYFCLATSRDGINFTKKGAVIIGAGSSEWDSTFLYDICVFTYSNYFFALYSAMYYTGLVYRYALGLAVSKDGMNFVKKGAILPLGASGDVDDNRILSGSALVKDGYLWIYYGAYDGSTTGIRWCLATYPIETYCNLA